MINTTLDKAVQEFEKTTKDLEQKLDQMTLASRKSALKRFPIFFTLITTFGAAAVIFGFERLLSSIPLFDGNPLLILLLGIATLVVTGTLYKKL